VYRLLCLNLPRRTKRPVPPRLRQPMLATELNAEWVLDFMHDSVYGGRLFRTLDVIDQVHQEALAIEADTSIPATRVVFVLEQLLELHGKSAAIR